MLEEPAGHAPAALARRVTASRLTLPPGSDEETDNPLRADDLNFYKVEKRIKHGTKLDRLLYAGNNLEKARDVFASAIRHQPRSFISRLVAAIAWAGFRPFGQASVQFMMV